MCKRAATTADSAPLHGMHEEVWRDLLCLCGWRAQPQLRTTQRSIWSNARCVCMLAATVHNTLRGMESTSAEHNGLTCRDPCTHARTGCSSTAMQTACSCLVAQTCLATATATAGQCLTVHNTTTRRAQRAPQGRQGICRTPHMLSACAFHPAQTHLRATTLKQHRQH